MATAHSSTLRSLRSLFSLLLGVGAGVAACAPARPPSTDTARAIRSVCDVLPGAPRRGGTILFGVTEGVDAEHAPTPTNAAERTLFRNLYETLVGVDCAGAVRPRLAASWSADESGRVWSFTLREGARFSDGTPLDATDVKLAWIAARRRTGAAGETSWAWLDQPADSVEAIDLRRLVVRLAIPAGASPALFADPMLAVVDRRAGEIWPIGSGPARVADQSVASEDDAQAPDLVLLPNPTAWPGPPPWEHLVFRVRPGWDARDLAAQGLDGLVVRERGLVSYFAGAGEFLEAPLPWDRTYGFLSRSKDLSERLADSRAELAREVVASDAAPSDAMGFGASRAAAATTNGAGAGAAGRDTDATPGRVLYLRGDADARRLAERAVALAATGWNEADRRQGASPKAVGMTTTEFASALRADPAASFVLRADRDRSFGLRALDATLVDAERSAVPLIATRPHFAARRGLAGVLVDWDGALRFDGAGWADAAPEDSAPAGDRAP